MGSLLKLTAFILSLNIFMYLGINYVIANNSSGQNAIRMQNDLFDLVMKNPNSFNSDMDLYFNSLQDDSITYGSSYELNNNFTTVPSQGAGIPSGTTTFDFGYLDSLKIVFAFLKTLLNFAIMPITLISMIKIPPLLILLIGIPINVIYYITIIFFIRGATP